MNRPPALPELRPAELQALLDGDWNTTGPLRLNERLSADDIAASLLSVNARRVIEAIREAGSAPLSPGGCLAAQFARSLARRLWWGPSGDLEPMAGQGELLDSEYSRALDLVCMALVTAGLLERGSGVYRVSPLAEGLLAPGRAGELLARLFRAYFREMDHSHIDHEPAIPRAWRYVPYALWGIGRLDGWHSAGTLTQLFVPADVLAAEDRRLQKVRRSGHRHGPTVALLFLMRLFELLEDFVVLESRAGQPEEQYPLEQRFRRGRLYDRLLRFEF